MFLSASFCLYVSIFPMRSESYEYVRILRILVPEIRACRYGWVCRTAAPTSAAGITGMHQACERKRKRALYTYTSSVWADFCPLLTTTAFHTAIVAPRSETGAACSPHPLCDMYTRGIWYCCTYKMIFSKTCSNTAIHPAAGRATETYQTSRKLQERVE